MSMARIDEKVGIYSEAVKGRGFTKYPLLSVKREGTRMVD